MKKIIKETLDTKSKLRCVRFTTGELGMVDEQDTPLITIGPYQNLCFATHGFLKISNQGRHIYIDSNNGELYTQIPEFIKIGQFELTSIGGMIYTRTNKIYEISEMPIELLETGNHGMYLTLPYDRELEEEIKDRMTVVSKPYQVCLLNGDNSGVYWFIDTFADGTPLVMDDEGNYYQVDADKKTKKAEKTLIGKVMNEATKAMMAYKTREIGAEREKKKKERVAAAQARAEKEREKQMQEMASAEPFKIGSKWGLRVGGRIVVPPIYRTIEPPIGHYSVMEVYPGFWGVVALDGKVEIEPKYENIVLHEDGTAEITSAGGKVITKKLP